MTTIQETYYCGSEATRRKALELAARAPLFDAHGRQLVVIIKRAVSDYGKSKKRRFHAYVNLIAEHLEAPAPAVKQTLKAHLCPLVEEHDYVTGETKFQPKGISDLSDEEAAALCEKTVKLAKEQWELHLPVTEEEFETVKYRGLDAIQEADDGAPEQ